MAETSRESAPVQAPESSAGLGKDLRRIGAHSSIYTLASLLSRGLNFALMLVYTRFMMPDEYGALAISLTVGALLSLILGLALDAAVTQMYFKYPSPEERRALYGSLLLFLLVVPGAAVLALEGLGELGLLNLLPGVPFRPYLRMVLWTSYAGTFVTVLESIYLSSQRPVAYLLMSGAHALLNLALSVGLVLVLRKGVAGALLASLVATVVLAIASIVLLSRAGGLRMSWTRLKEALKFSVPVVPHMVSHWALNQSDRYVLGRYASTSQIGVYTVGFQFAMPVSVFIGAVSNAIFPIMNARLGDERRRHEVPALGTYTLFAFTFVGLGAALVGGDLVRWWTPPAYHPAVAVVPWVVLGCLFQGLNTVWSRGTWFSMKTAWVPVLTVLAATLNVGLNLWLIPVWGVLASAINMAVGYAVLALLQGWLSVRLHPIGWEYARWLTLALAAGACFALGTWFDGGHLAVNLAVKSAITILVFPALLYVVPFLTPSEKEFIRSIPGRFRAIRLVSPSRSQETRA